MGSASFIRRRGVALVIAGPSGVGKSAIAQGLLALEPQAMLSVSVTTRMPRAGEVDGIHYDFRDRAAFDALLAEGELLEWAEVFGERYGTRRAPVVRALEEGRDAIFDIDWQGHRRLRAVLPGDVVGVVMLPAARRDLEARLAARGDPPERVASRMAGAWTEIEHWREFDHAVVNRDLGRSISAVRTILEAARLATARQTGLAELIAGLG